jgi:S-DNA-T family DNA segregation ATPase FtsK/SpoIIIE
VPGTTAQEVISQRAKLAAGLNRPEGCVWPSNDPETPAGHLVLWVGDKPMSQMGKVKWPLSKDGKVDLFKPFPIGVDPQGNPVSVTLMFTLGVIGAIPRFGKTFLLRLLAVAAALDPTAELHIYGLKGGADWTPLEMVAHRYRSGEGPGVLDYLRDDLRDLQYEVARRYETIERLYKKDKNLCPEGKTTRQLADLRQYGLFPIVLVIDECQVAFEDKEIGALITDLGKRGPAAGIIVLLATQRVDKESLPTGISANAILRWCFKVMSQTEVDLVLGTSAHKRGWRPNLFGDNDKGLCYMAGAGIVRVALVDGPEADRICARARAVRLAAGLLSGHAANEEPDADNGILNRLSTVWPDAEEKVRWEDLADRLIAAYPGAYAGWTGKQVASAVRPHKLTACQVKRVVDGQATNRWGLARAELTRALDDRSGQPEIEAGVSDA